MGEDLSILFQFHGTRAELLRLAEEWAIANGWNVVLERFFPDDTIELMGQKSFVNLPAADVADRVILVTAPVDLHVRTGHEFLSRNPEALIVDLPSSSEGQLREAAISGLSATPSLIRTWRALIRTLRDRLHRGATVHGPMGAAVHLATHRHTPGAHELAGQGVTMLAAAGDSEYQFDDLDVT